MQLFEEAQKKFNKTGNVVQIQYPFVEVENLPEVHVEEVVAFSKGALGKVFKLSVETTTVLILNNEPVHIGDSAIRTGSFLSVPLGEHLLGKALTPLGHPFSSLHTFFPSEEHYPIEVKPLNISQRLRIQKPLVTGMSIVDMLIPLGRGQRQLIIGNRKTGKTTFLLSLLSQQQTEDTIIIYAAIGKKQSDIKQLEEYFTQHKLFEQTILVASSASDNPGLIALTPFTAMRIAEYFRDKGKDTLVILDDLSTHAIFYRELSLLAKQFPGRDSYPGDIFHIHARLLERAGNYKREGKDVAITCLAVTETTEGELTGYITTNLMSMTDGHLYFDENLYTQGQRPAINSNLSVTRVGKQIQTPLQRNIGREILSILTLYEKTKNLSHLSTEISDHAKEVLVLGERIHVFFNQPPTLPLSPEVQMVIFALVWNKLIPTETIRQAATALQKTTQNKACKDLLHGLIARQTFPEFLEAIEQNKSELLSYVNHS